MVARRTKAVLFAWRVESVGGGDGPFQTTGLCYRPRYQYGGPRRPGPNSVPELSRAMEQHCAPRFAAFSLPNLRHWFPRSEVKWLARHHPGEFEVALYRARDAIVAGRQAVFDSHHGERIAAFPLSDLHRKGALK